MPEMDIVTAAERYNASPHTIRSWIKKGWLPAQLEETTDRHGRRQKKLMIKQSDFEELYKPSRGAPEDEIEAHFQTLVAKAPPFSPSQIARLSAIFQGKSFD